jgi:hypothetical protein
MNELCERCLEDGIQKSGTVDEFGNGPWCDDCRSSQAEAAHERMLEDFYGGCGPVTIHEQCAAADKQRRALRRLD